MKKTLLTALVLILTAVNIILLLPRTSTAQQPSFFNVMPFTTQSGRMGFFNQQDGMIYIYDADVNKLLFKAQLKDLGTDIEYLERNDKPLDNKYGGKSKSIIVPTNNEEQP